MVHGMLKLKVRLPWWEAATVVELNDVNLKQKIGEFKEEVTKKIVVEQDKYELTFCGSILENEAILESYGVKPGMTLHILERKSPPVVTEPAPISDETVTRLASIFMSLSENDSFRYAFQRLTSREDFNANLIEAIPALKSDLVSLTMVNDPILMLHFTDVDTIMRVAKAYPTLIQIAQYIAAAVQTEAMKNPSSSSSNPIAGSSSMNFDLNIPFGMDSDEDDMDSSQSSDVGTPLSTAMSTPNSGITIAQLNAALANARSNPNSSVPRISSEMFTQAMQQAVDVSSSANSTGMPVTPVTPVSPMVPTPPGSVPQGQNIQGQLNLMHEMGLLDDAVNIQALHFTNGDVQAAIELVFSGFGDN